MDNISLNAVLVAYVALVVYVGYIIWKNRTTLNCADLITNRAGKISRIALANLSGVIIASWIPIHMAITRTMDGTVFATCLVYLAAVEGYSKWLAHKEDAAKK